jgi:glycosyltransferase involved in cell wall biosynthesis
MNLCLDNVIFSLQSAGGISRYWGLLCNNVSKFNLYVTFYGDSKASNIFKPPHLIENAESKISYNLLRYLPFQSELPSSAIFHSSYYRISTQKGVSNITTVHDFTYEKFRKGIPRLVHSAQKNNAIRRSSGIICVSESTRLDLLDFHPTIDDAYIKVIYNGIGNEFFPIEENQKEIFFNRFFPNITLRPFVLFVGQRSGYKGFSIVEEAIYSIPDLGIISVGGEEFNPGLLATLNRKVSWALHLPSLSDTKLNVLYNNAVCLVYPSSYEGFGMPVLEALKAGCPVIAKKISSIPEVGGDAVFYLKHDCADELREAINRIMEDDFLKDSLIKKGIRQSDRFSWDRCIKETVDFYKDITF